MPEERTRRDGRGPVEGSPAEGSTTLGGDAGSGGPHPRRGAERTDLRVVGQGSALGGQRSPRDAPGEKPVDLNVALVARDQDLRALLGSYLARAHETPFRLVASGSSLRAALDAPVPCDAIVIAGASGPAITSARVAAADRPDLAIVLLVDACTAAVEAEAVAAGAADILDLEDLDVDRLERAVRLAVARGRRATSRP